MRFNPTLEICAFLFMIIVAIHFFSKPRFPNKQTRFFAAFVIIGLIDVVADIASAYVIEYSAQAPMWINWTVNMILFYCQVALAPMLFLYILTMTNSFVKKNYLRILIVMLPFIATMVLLTLNPWSGIYFYFDEDFIYQHGAQFLHLYIGTAFYLVISALYALHRRNVLRSVITMSILGFVVIIIASIVLQYLFPEYLLTGVALGMALLMMYLALQNPDDMLDPVSGVFNRQSFLLYLGQLFEKSSRFHLVLVDISGLRTVNTLFGIAMGDHLLELVGAYLRHVSKHDQAFRLIGDTFAIICRGEAECLCAAKQMALRFREPWMVGEMKLNLSAGVGYVFSAESCGSTDNVIAVVEHTIKHLKKTESIDPIRIEAEVCYGYRRRTEMEAMLRSALDENRVEVFFQPEYNLSLRRFSSMEALSRLRDENGKLISPADFIPVAERTGLIVRLGEQVLRKTFAFLKESGLEEDPEFSCICVNLSPVECLDDSLVPKIERALRDYGVNPKKICLEITESTATISEHLPEKMEHLKELGFRFALDDFGTGYANYDAVMRLPFSTVKLDKSMLDSSETNPKTRTVFLRTVDMVHALGCDVIVEGVEREDQVRFLGKHSIYMLQGFYFARPMPPQEALSLVRSGRDIPDLSCARLDFPMGACYAETEQILP